MKTMLLAMLCVGCGNIAEKAPMKTAVDAAADVATADAPVMQLGPFSAPVPIVELDTTGTERGVSLTGDLLEIYFVSDRAGGLGGTDIWTASRTSATATWGAATPVTAVNSVDSESHTYVTRDGLQLYFAVLHTGSTTATDLYVSVRANRVDAWSPPTLATDLDSAADDVAVGMSADGLELALDSTRAGASGRDLYLAKRADPTQPWGIPEGIAELDTAAAQKTPQLADGGRALWFVQGATSDDIYVATRPSLDAPFGTPVAVDELNTTTGEDDPWISDDQRTIVFMSARSGNDDLFIATR